MKLIFLALSVMSALPAAPLLAQATGSLVRPAPAQMPERGKLSDAEQARATMYNYAACVAKSSPGRLRAYLQTFPGSNEARRVANTLSSDDCLSTGELRFSETLFRGGAYDVLYRKQFRVNGPTDLNAVAPLDYASGGDAEVLSNVSSIVALRKLADCTVRRSPANARTLILSTIGSKSEDTAFAGIVPNMSACMPADTKLKFSKAMFRGTVSEVLYRLSMAAQPSVAAQ